MKFEAILFDCDGVLVDSEPITHGVLRQMLAEHGWDMPIEECMRHFIGRTVRSQAALIAARTPEQQAVADALLAEVRRDQLFDAPIVTEVAPLAHYFAAEDHQTCARDHAVALRLPCRRNPITAGSPRSCAT